MDNYDYIIVGAGSAGCVTATRLVEAGKSVLLLEAGYKDSSIWHRLPAGVVRLSGSKYLTNYETEPEAGALGRRIPMTQSNTLGGGSSVNGMIYLRGQREDYDDWRDAGCDGWSYEDVLPFFKKSEDNQLFVNDFHEPGGPLKVARPKYYHPYCTAFFRAGQEAGIPYNEDFNGARQEGIGFFPTTSFEGRRQSTPVAFLSRVINNPLLVLKTETGLDELILENGCAVGVKYRSSSNNQVVEARVREEVILSAGALSTPKILQLAGIGPADLLGEMGIPVRRAIAAVGQNFQDHFNVPVKVRSVDQLSYTGQDKGLRAISNGLQWLLFRTGILTSNLFESGAFIDTAGTGRPDVQLHFFPAILPNLGDPPSSEHGMTLSACVLRPKARGSVTISSADRAAPVRIVSNIFDNDNDIATMLRGLKIMRKIIAMPALRALVKDETTPGRLGEDVPDEVLIEHGKRHARTVFHPCGTCRMGSDEDSVVDTSLRVRGVPRLRVADASVMPGLVSSNTNAASIMIGERCADFLLNGA